MKRVVFTDKALSDIRSITAWFRDKRDGSDERFEAEVGREIMYICATPEGYAMRRPPFRFAMLEHFRYFLIYAVSDDEVVIHRVRHMHQRPLKRYFGH